MRSYSPERGHLLPRPVPGGTGAEATSQTVLRPARLHGVGGVNPGPEAERSRRTAETLPPSLNGTYLLRVRLLQPRPGVPTLVAAVGGAMHPAVADGVRLPQDMIGDRMWTHVALLRRRPGRFYGHGENVTTARRRRGTNAESPGERHLQRADRRHCEPAPSRDAVAAPCRRR
jgi:hypothetical protein